MFFRYVPDKKISGELVYLLIDSCKLSQKLDSVIHVVLIFEL